MNFKNKMVFVILSFGIATLMFSSSGNNTFQKQTFISTFAQQENEAEVNTDMEQENKCKKDTECENENELNNELSIVNITQTTTAEPQTTLNVIKTLTCEADSVEIECPQELVPEDVEITVIANNPSPAQFQGSAGGTLVTLGAGDYTIIEVLSEIPADVESSEAIFSGDCTQTDATEGEGTIEDGESQTCTIENIFYFRGGS